MKDSINKGIPCKYLEEVLIKAVPNRIVSYISNNPRFKKHPILRVLLLSHIGVGPLREGLRKIKGNMKDLTMDRSSIIRELRRRLN